MKKETWNQAIHNTKEIVREACEYMLFSLLFLILIATLCVGFVGFILFMFAIDCIDRLKQKREKRNQEARERFWKKANEKIEFKKHEAKLQGIKDEHENINYA